MTIGRISGPLLKSNLLRDGVDLAFENDLLYLDVNNLRVGIKTSSPTHDLTVNGTARTTNLEVTTQADIGPITVTNSSISTSDPVLYLNPATNNVVYQTSLTVDDIDIDSNIISTNNGDKDLELRPNGTGRVVAYSDARVEGSVYVTGDITLDGNINVGDQDTDSVVINADVASNIIPNITDFYDIGSSSKRWNDVWVNNFQATTVTAGSIIVDGVDISTEQGNIYYVAANGSNSNDGRHQNDPLATLEYALSLSTAGDTIFIYPGVYQEVTPLVIPKGVTVKGVALRSVIIEPDTGSQADDIFHLDGEVTIEDLTIRGFYYDNLNDTGYAFKFKPGFKVTNRSPYIRNVTVITQGSVTSTLDPRGFDSGDAGRGAYLDGAVADPTTNEASCLFSSVTFLCPNVDTVTMKNGVRIEWLNCFTYWANKGLYGLSGNSGIGGSGQTKLKVSGTTGVYNIGDTVTYYDDDGITVLASGTIADIVSNEIYINGKATGFVEFDERVGKPVTPYGNAQLSNTTAKFGTTSLALDGTGDYIFVASNEDFDFGTGDFTIEGWFYRNVGGVQVSLFDFRTIATQNAPWLFITAGGTLVYYVNGSTRISGAGGITPGTWYHVAVSKNGTNTRMFVDGTQIGSTWIDTTNYIQGPLTVGARYTGALEFFNGYIDDIRISKGIARYTGAFAQPTTALSNDINTVLLLHFTGTPGSTTFNDDSVLVQDVRFSPSGATARYIDLADYTDFGCEVRSIGSVCVYGNYGIYGAGDGVIMYLIGQNLAYIGSGKDTTNDPNLVIQANEVVQLNNAKIYYTSVDARGDFRVGDLFFVDQQTGNIQFSSSIVNVVGPNGITLTDGSNTTVIQPSKIETGDLRISGNTIESLTNEINFVAANDIINLDHNVNVAGDINVTGDVTIGGNIRLGDSSVDSIIFNGGIASDLVPSTSATFNLGLPNYQWKELWVRIANISDIKIDTNYITTTVSNADLELRANGTGAILVEDIRVNQRTISTDSGNISIIPSTTLDITAVTTTVNGDLRTTNNFSVDGNTTLGNSNTDTVNFNARVASDISPVLPNTYNLGSPTLSWKTTYLSSATIDDIQIDTNIIRTTVSNSNLELRANGTGSVLLEQVRINENTINTDGSTNLELRPATTLDIFGNTNINGDLNVTGNVNIGGNITIGNDPNDIIDFEGEIGSDLIPALPVTYNIGSSSNRWKTLFVGNAFISDIEINTNYIRTTVSNADLELRANGTGAIKLEDVSVNQNIISVPTGTNLVLQPSGTGVVDVNSTQALRIPRGTTLQQPAVPQTGMIRYNTTNNNYEGYDGTYWRVLNGLYDVDQNTYLVAESTPGANDDTFYFYSNNVQIADLNSTRLNVLKIIVDDISIDGNTISTINNQTLNLTASGTGTVKMENLSIKGSTITNTVSGSVTTLVQTGTGYFKIDGTTGFVIPVGTGAERPSGTPETGFMRFNTDDSRVEIYDGTQWASAAGSSSGVTVAEAEEIAILRALMLG